MSKLSDLFPIAKKQRLVTGYSNGGIGSWKYAESYPKLFCAAIPMAGYYEPQKLDIPLYVIHGNEDELFTSDQVRNGIEISKKMGSQIDFTIVKDLSHYMACSYVQPLREKVLLIQKTLWN